MLTVGYPGREGAHSAGASAVLYPDARLLPLPSFRAVADAVTACEVEVGVLPIESSLVGPVAETHDLLYGSALAIVAQTVLPIDHCLAGLAGAALESIRVVHSHPVALDQCRRLLGSLPLATAVAAPTTADAALEVARLGDPAHAAIASERAAALNGLAVLAANVGDHPEAYTRFVAVATHTRLDRNGTPFRTAFSFVTDHRPGSLYHALGPFARHGLNLVQLVSRPIPHSTFRYRFDMVLDGHPLDPEIRTALAEMGEWTREVRIFGSYEATGSEI